jgi:hypothetical protein
VEECRAALQKLETGLQENDRAEALKYAGTARQVARYYLHYQKLAESNEKDPAKREAYSQLIQGWREKSQRLAELLGVPD